MSDDGMVARAYGGRAGEYIDFSANAGAPRAADLATVRDWARHLDGRLLDAGCGPGQWTAYLDSLGHEVSGVDMVPQFVAHARSRYPHLDFATGGLDALDVADGGLAGIMAWYCLIHRAPETLPEVLAEFRRALRPGGSLLIGFFRGDTLEPFAHAVTTAYRWPVDTLAQHVTAAGFAETRRTTRADPGARPHAALSFTRRSGNPDLRSSTGDPANRDRRPGNDCSRNCD